ncbi:glycopeptide antibiotics resistance protein [Clostridia bacterium]|nr:glycopeptide antibiotics resistance protein [Clostridia bacterium]
MTTYFFPIEVAAIFFIFIALALTLPYAIFVYRKYGAVSIWRAIVIYSFVFYMECAYFMCILPLPDPNEVAKQSGDMYQLIPFEFVRDFIKNSGFDIASPSTWLKAIKTSYFYIPIFNVLLTVPFGVYLAYYFKKSFTKVVIFTFLLSLFYELTQLTALYGFYSRPYRIFDVDDLIQNTVGGAVGYCAYLILRHILPSQEKIRKSEEKRSAKVGYIRRLVAFIIDQGILYLILIVNGIAFQNNKSWYDSFLLMLYSVVAVLFWQGTTLGKRVVRIKLEPDSRLRMFIRYTLRNILIIVFGISLNNEFVPIIIALLCMVDLIYAQITKKGLWYERITKTKNISTFKKTEKNSP